MQPCHFGQARATLRHRGRSRSRLSGDLPARSGNLVIAEGSVFGLPRFNDIPKTPKVQLSPSGLGEPCRNVLIVGFGSISYGIREAGFDGHGHALHRHASIIRVRTQIVSRRVAETPFGLGSSQDRSVAGVQEVDEVIGPCCQILRRRCQVER